MPPSRIPRPLSEMIDALECQLNLLEDYSERAFRDNQKPYVSEVANKLRLLVGRFGSNKPLLFQVAEAIGTKVLVVLDGPPVQQPPPGTVMALEEFFDRNAVGVQSRRVPHADEDSAYSCTGRTAWWRPRRFDA
jgi:hypothetical protein